MVVIPLREVVLVEKVDNTGRGDLGADSLVVTTRGKVQVMLHRCTGFLFKSYPDQVDRTQVK